MSDSDQLSGGDQPQLRSRHGAREAALRAVYAAIVGGLTLQEALAADAEEWNFHPSSQSFCERLANAALRRSSEWDALIEPKLGRSWGLDRLAVIDHVCLWCGLGELFTEAGIPPKVTITEWVRLVKKYGGRDSHSFVHGLLGAILPETPKADWRPEMEEEPEEDEMVITALEPDLEELTVDAEDPELEKAKKLGAWQVRAEEEG